MPVDVVMPKLGLNMTEGLLLEWLKKEGDPVQRGEALFIVETDKVTTESEAQVSERWQIFLLKLVRSCQ
jgi:pyruvate/2-oxoglutarate dehydrogenase complex dihydrolipoamide acyltransferase (E2) component